MAATQSSQARLTVHLAVSMTATATGSAAGSAASWVSARLPASCSRPASPAPTSSPAGSTVDARTAICASTVLTWLDDHPVDGFAAAVATGRGGEPLSLPERNVVVPPSSGVVGAGRELFDWLRRQRLAVVGPTVEEHLVDGDGAAVTVLEVPVA
ncbi:MULTISPECIES: hypothetical protein [Saccharothrix]|uniref:hypothetical protein n=1 Tax=Saccharothrix TaxID=2071 RepID=UPI00094035C5|nr:hypothetical protein [Saccharothrix sp. CB00851]OKI13802.1 hypothetical protein A6A25_16075 [Saccharothrix sp. CB00851]